MMTIIIGAVTADGDKSLDSQLIKSAGDSVDELSVGSVKVRPRGTQDGATTAGIEFRDCCQQGIEWDVGQLIVEQTGESIEQSKDLDSQLVRTCHGAVQGGIQRGGVPAGREDGESFHWLIGPSGAR